MNRLLNLAFNFQNPNNVRFLVPADSAGDDESIVPQDMGFTTKKAKLLQLSSRLDLSNKISVGCAGVVLAYLQRRRSGEYLPDDSAASYIWRVAKIEMFSLKETM